MSKIGKKPIALPSGVTVTVTEGQIKVKGPKGELQHPSMPSIQVLVNPPVVTVKREGDEAEQRRAHGLVRASLQNMITGVTTGFQKKLEMIGVGYRAQAAGKKITLNLGFSHPIEYHAPAGITLEMDAENKSIIIVSGIDRQKVGQVAAQLRAYRPPEPYKGKGIRYVGEYVPRKTGKAAVTTSE